MAANASAYEEWKKARRRRRRRRRLFFFFAAVAVFSAWAWKCRENEVRDVFAWSTAKLDEAKAAVLSFASSVSAGRRADTAAVSAAGIPGADGAAAPASAAAAKGAAAWMKAPNWTRAKAANIDDLTQKDIDAIETWDAQKGELRAAYDELRGAIASVTSVPAFRYDSGKLSALGKALEDMGACLDGNDPLRMIYDAYPRVESAANAWRSSVRWQAGVKHPVAPHVHSGASRGSWEPDDGYVFANASSDSLDVIYKGHAYRCSNCQGTGSVTRRNVCPKCSGRGRIPNPALTALNTGAAVADLIGAFSKHGSRRPPIRQVDDPGIQCPQCRGRTFVTERESCPHCENGTVWK